MREIRTSGSVGGADPTKTRGGSPYPDPPRRRVSLSRSPVGGKNVAEGMLVSTGSSAIRGLRVDGDLLRCSRRSWSVGQSAGSGSTASSNRPAKENSSGGGGRARAATIDPGVRSRLSEQGAELCDEKRHVLLDGAPEDLRVDAEVAVREDVAEADEVGPGDLRVSQPRFG